MTRKTKNLIVAVVVLAFCAASASATLVRIDLTAKVSEVDDPGGLLKDKIKVGDIITGHYIYDSDTPDTDWNGGVVSDTVGDYWHRSSPYGIYLSGGGFIFQTNPDNVKFLVEIINDSTSGRLHDAYGLRSYKNSPLSDKISVEHIAWWLRDNSATALSSDALPTTSPVLANYADTWFGLIIEGGSLPLRSTSFFIKSDVISAVPEPSTLVLLGLAGLALIRKRRPTQVKS